MAPIHALRRDNRLAIHPREHPTRGRFSRFRLMHLLAPPRGAVLVLLCGVVTSIHLSGCSMESPPPPPSVLLVTFDTLRADYVGAYHRSSRRSDGLSGPSISATPGLDALAARGMLFENAIAASSLTVPAHVAIMTGHWPREASVGTRNGDIRLDETLEILAERFGSAGYQTAAFIGNFVLNKSVGLDRGFDLYDDEFPSAELNRPHYFERVAGDTAARARSWLSNREGDRPFFLWIHLQDPHGPYTPPPPPTKAPDPQGTIFPNERVDLPIMKGNIGRDGIPAYQALEGATDRRIYLRRYAEEIRYADESFADILAAAGVAAGNRGLVTLATADHGEALGEDGFYFQHGHSTRPELARVPLLIAGPGIPKGRFTGYVSHVDIAPTLLHLTGLPPLPDARGIALVRLAAHDELPPERWLLCDTHGEVGVYAEGRYVRAIGPGALDLARGETRLSFAALDPEFATKEFSEMIPESARQRILGYLSEQVGLETIEDLSKSDLARLRALGYLEDAAEARN
jgi:arylsulfatase